MAVTGINTAICKLIKLSVYFLLTLYIIFGFGLLNVLKLAKLNIKGEYETCIYINKFGVSV